MVQSIIRLALPVPVRRYFDYLAPQEVDIAALIPGVRVKVSFQSRTLVGILLEVVEETSISLDKLKTAMEVLDTAPILTEEVIQLCHFAADYYHYSLGEVFASALPALLRKGKPTVTKMKSVNSVQTKDHSPVLNQAQQDAITAITDAKNIFQVFLLDGVTGSGKTEVYLRTIQEKLNDGKQVLMLVPEISLTPQTIERFRARFQEKIVALHSNLSERERLEAWLLAKSGEAKIVIGTRSAIFTPFANLGLIIVDEEHDTSFKQQDRFRYHARDLAIMRASINKIPIVLGSATPSLESLLNAKRKRYVYLSLPERAGVAQLPVYQILDLHRLPAEEGLSQALLDTMKMHLAAGNQVLLFLNRRGYAPVLYCKTCAWMAGCKRCATRLVYHRHPQRLQCHYCDAKSAIPTKCGECGSETLQAIGLGTQRLEETLAKHFSDVPIIRVDRDSTRKKGAMQDLLTQIHTQQKAILIGTQMLAKGHHFPHVTLVAVVDTDSGLFSADFRAAEQMGQLLVQVAGRAGRAEKPGTVVIQTRQPQHVLLQILIHQGYHAFAETLLKEREAAMLPPFAYFAVFRAESYTDEPAQYFLNSLKNSDEYSKAITLLGPVPALISKRKGLYCHHLLVRADKRSTLQQFLKKILEKIAESKKQSVKWILDVDPIEVG